MSDVDSKNMQASPTGALRDNKGKAPFSLMPFIALHAFGTVLFRSSVRGGGRYPMGNWTKGAQYSTPIDSLLRHVFKRVAGEKIDPDDGLPHTWKILVNAVFLVYYENTYPELDDLNAARELPSDKDGE